MLDGAEFGGGGEDAHVVELVEEELLMLAPGRIIGRQKRQAVGELSQGL
jgi:hypothetical protein